MDPRWPSHFTRLPPFRGLFETGFPILTYHKFGPRPAHARLRGLYLETALFMDQVRELRAAGLKLAPVGAFRDQAPGTAAALTIDDGFRSVREHALPVLRRAGVRATLYLVVDRLGDWNDWETVQGEVPARLMDPSEVKDWLAAGQRIGAHTLTHPWLTQIPPAQAREEIVASRRKLEDRFGVAVQDFCYPYGDWNEAVRDLVVEAGYRTAVTTDFGVNTPGSPPHALRRITARHATRGMRGIRGWLRRAWAGFRGPKADPVQVPAPPSGASSSASDSHRG